MEMKGNTILITGGGSGIGLALAEQLHKLGNQIIIAGRRKETLAKAAAANPGMKTAVLDIESNDSIQKVAATLMEDFPQLNVVIQNAGAMKMEKLGQPGDLSKDAESMVITNLLGPIRLTAALLPHLQRQASSAVMMVSSGLAFVPLAAAPTYCATKAALHSYTLSLRYQLRGTSTEVIELIPPYVQTELGGAHQATDPNAMPLAEFISEVMEILSAKPTPSEIVVKRCEALRVAGEGSSFGGTFEQLNQMFA